MSLVPPWAFPCDAPNEIDRKSKENALRHPGAFPSHLFKEINQTSNENEPDASKGSSYRSPQGNLSYIHGECAEGLQWLFLLMPLVKAKGNQ